MRTKQFIAAILISCGIMSFGATQTYAQTTPGQQQTKETEPVRPGFVNIDFVGFQSGSVQLYITNNGEQQYFLGTSAGTIGHFAVVGDTFDIEIGDIPWWTAPSFKYLSGSPNLRIEKKTYSKYHVVGEDIDQSGAYIVLVFGN